MEHKQDTGAYDLNTLTKIASDTNARVRLSVELQMEILAHLTKKDKEAINLEVAQMLQEKFKESFEIMKPLRNI